MRRSEVEEEIFRHREIVRQELHAIAAKTRLLNNLLPVSKLLPELLADIFMYFAADYSAYASLGSTPGPYSWIVVTHVCHHWRSVALNAPGLWRFIYLGAPDLVQLYLSRSSHAPLCIRSWIWIPRAEEQWGWWPNKPRSVPPSNDLTSLNLIFLQVSRIQELSLGVPDYILQRAFAVFNAEGFDAPALQMLKLNGVNNSSFPNILNKCSLPALKSVEIRGYSIPWELPFLYLDLTNLVLHPSSPDSLLLEKLLNALFYMPSLQTFELINEHCDGLCESPRTNVALRSVELPLLQRLHLHLDVFSVDAFLLHCTFPSSTIVHLNAEVRHVHPLPYSSKVLRSIIVNSLMSSIAPPITALAIDFESLYVDPDPPRPCRMSFRTYNIDASTIDIVLPSPTFTIRFCHQQGSHLPELLEELLCDLPLSEVVYIRICTSSSCRVFPSSHKLAKFLATLISRCSASGLHTLSVSRRGIDLLCSLLSLPLHDWLQLTSNWRCSGRETGLFGCVKTLVVTAMKRSQRRQRHSQLSDICDAILEHAKYYRSTCGPFSKLILQQCFQVRSVLLSMVDAVAQLLCQEGRFTENLPLVPFNRLYPPPNSVADYPDSDLDLGDWGDGLSSSPDVRPIEGDWVDHLRSYGRVTFDFRGDTGITIEQNVASPSNENLL
ncbi:unnamed protein product [Somion occarium]